jgi:hypothetical protein
MLPWRLLREEECNRLGCRIHWGVVLAVLSVSGVRRANNTQPREPFRVTRRTWCSVAGREAQKAESD